MLAAYGNKIDLFPWIDPERHTVRQRITVEKCQLDKDGFAAVSVKPILRQPGFALDASARRPYLECLPILCFSAHSDGPIPKQDGQQLLPAMCASCLPLALYGSAALVKVVPPPPAASTLTMLAPPGTAALRKHEANL